MGVRSKWTQSRSAALGASVPPRPARASKGDSATLPRRSQSAHRSSGQASRSQDIWLEDHSMYQHDASTAACSGSEADPYAHDGHADPAGDASGFSHVPRRRPSGSPQGLESSLSRGASAPSRLRTVSFDYPGTASEVRPLPWDDAPPSRAASSPSPRRNQTPRARTRGQSQPERGQSRPARMSGSQEAVQHSGWLLRCHGHGTHREWKRQWVSGAFHPTAVAPCAEK